MSKQFVNGPRTNAFWLPPEQILLVGVEIPKDDPTWGVLYDPRVEQPPDEALITSMVESGWIGSLDVVKDLERNAVIAVVGRRRILAAREANKRIGGKDPGKLINVRIVPVQWTKGDLHRLSEIMVSENELRENLDPLRKAEVAELWLQRGGDPKQIARAFGVTEQTVRNMGHSLEVCKSVPQAKKAYEQGLITFTALTKLHGMNEEEIPSELEKLTEGGTKKATQGKVQKAVAKKAGKPSIPSAKEVKGIISIIEERLHTMKAEIMFVKIADRDTTLKLLAEDASFAAGALWGLRYGRALGDTGQEED